MTWPQSPRWGVPGDFNDHGTADAADYAVWRDLLDTVTTLPNHPTSGTVESAHYAVWGSHFGQSAGRGAGGAYSAAVASEPGGSALLLAAAMLPIAAAQVHSSARTAGRRR